jgi:hypothetical protein
LWTPVVVDVVVDPTAVLDVLELGVELVVGDDVDVGAVWVVVVTRSVVVVGRCGTLVAAPDGPAVVPSVRRPANVVSAVMATTDGLRRWSRSGTAIRYFGDGERPVASTAHSRSDWA